MVGFDFLTFIDFQLREKKLDSLLFVFSTLFSLMLGEELNSVSGVSQSYVVVTVVGDETVLSSEG